MSPRSVIRKRILIGKLCAALWLAGSGAAAKDGAGTTAFNFLRTGVGAGPVSLGEAYTGMSGSAWSAFYNPAGLGALRHREAAFAHEEIGEGIRQEAFAYAQPFKNAGTWALSGSWTGIQDIAGYDAAGAKTGSLSARSYLLGLGWARDWAIGQGRPDWESGVSAGLNLKGFRETLDTESASGFAGDAGVLWRTPLQAVSLAAGVRNLGSAAAFVSRKEKLPSSASLGMRLEPLMMGSRLNLLFDAHFLGDGDRYFAQGLEVPVGDSLFLRQGFTTRDDLASGLRLGFGARVSDCTLDYAFVPRGDFDNSHRVSISFRFGGDVRYLPLEEEIREHFERGRRLYGRGRYLAAYNAFQSVLAAAPGHLQAQEYAQKAKLRLSEADILGEIDRRLARGLRLHRRGQLFEARAEFKAVLELAPGHAEAQEHLKAIEAQYQDAVTGIVKEALRLLEQGDLEPAEKEVQRALALSPADAQALSVRDAVSKRRQALENERRLAEANQLYQRGLHLENLQQWEQAFSFFSEASRLDPGRAEIGAALSRVGARKTEAERRIGLRNRQEAPALNQKALELYAAGRLAEALALWEKALQLDPSLESARTNLERVRKELRKSGER